MLERGGTMLSKSQMMKIALNECVDMIGKDIVKKHKDLCSCSCGIKENGMFSYCLGMDTKRASFVIGKETPMEYYAFVFVDPKTGNVTRDYKNSTLPN